MMIPSFQYITKTGWKQGADSEDRLNYPHLPLDSPFKLSHSLLPPNPLLGWTLARPQGITQISVDAEPPEVAEFFRELRPSVACWTTLKRSPKATMCAGSTFQFDDDFSVK
jgi:hypothetical protein